MTAVLPVAAPLGPVSGPPRDPARIAIAAGVGLVLCVGVPGWALSRLAATQAVDIQVGQLSLVAFAVTAWAGLRISAAVLPGRLRPMEFLFFSYVYVWLGLAATVQLAAGQTPVPAPTDDDMLLQRAVVIVVAGVAAWEVGALLGRRRRPVGPAGPARTSDLRLPLAVALLALSPVLIPLLGGVSALFRSRQATAEALIDGGLLTEGDKAGGSILVALVTVTAFVLLYLALWRLGRVHKTGLLDWTTIGGLVVLNVIVNNPISAPRYWFGTVALSLVLLNRKMSTGWRARTFMLGLIACLVVLFPYADKYRLDPDSGIQGYGDVPLAEQFVVKSDYDSFPQVANAAALVQEDGLSRGRQLEGVLLFWVPRAIWPDKPFDTGIVLARFQNFTVNENLSAPLWAEFYVNFGLAGVVLGFGGLGLLTRRLDDGYLRDLLAGRYSILTAVVPVLAVYQLIVLRGSLLQSMIRLSVLVVLGLVLLRKERPQHHD